MYAFAPLALTLFNPLMYCVSESVEATNLLRTLFAVLAALEARLVSFRPADPSNDVTVEVVRVVGQPAFH